jgi:hypothetical protein
MHSLSSYLKTCTYIELRISPGSERKAEGAPKKLLAIALLLCKLRLKMGNQEDLASE